MRTYFILLSIVLAYFIVAYSHYKGFKGVEYFEDTENTITTSVIVPVLDIDKLKYGYLNTFYTALLKEPLELLKEPLPLQGISEPSKNSSTKTSEECKRIFDLTNLTVNNPKEVIVSRRNFSELDKDPLKPFLKYCDSNKLKYKRDVLDIIVKDCAIIALKLKQIYNRPRPYQLCNIYGYPIKYLRSEHADTPSYPSSYALQSYVIGYLLGNRYPKHQSKIEKITDEISWSRVYSGNNFESDIECSKAIMFNLRNYLDTIEI